MFLEYFATNVANLITLSFCYCGSCHKSWRIIYIFLFCNYKNIRFILILEAFRTSRLQLSIQLFYLLFSQFWSAFLYLLVLVWSQFLFQWVIWMIIMILFLWSVKLENSQHRGPILQNLMSSLYHSLYSTFYVNILVICQ